MFQKMVVTNNPQCKIPNNRIFAQNLRRHNKNISNVNGKIFSGFRNLTLKN
jgi:hypothetical protein